MIDFFLNFVPKEVEGSNPAENDYFLEKNRKRNENLVQGKRGGGDLYGYGYYFILNREASPTAIQKRETKGRADPFAGPLVHTVRMIRHGVKVGERSWSEERDEGRRGHRPVS